MASRPWDAHTSINFRSVSSKQINSLHSAAVNFKHRKWENEAPFGFGGCLPVVHVHAGIEDRGSSCEETAVSSSQLVMTVYT